jgi:hypothetical protein
MSNSSVSDSANERDKWKSYGRTEDWLSHMSVSRSRIPRRLTVGKVRFPKIESVVVAWQACAEINVAHVLRDIPPWFRWS